MAFDVSSLPDSVSLDEGVGGLPRLCVATPTCTGELYLHGAHVTAWAPAGADPVLWLSSTSSFQSDKAIRGGVPICAPWFGPGWRGERTPAHGWARTGEWALDSVIEDGDRVLLRLCLDGPDASMEFLVGFGAALEMQLTVTATERIELEAALHSYLAVTDVREITVEGLAGWPYVDKMAGGAVVTPGVDESASVRLDGPTDRVYRGDGEVRVIDAAAGRSIGLVRDGATDVVLWNPWEDAAAGMADVGPGEWTGFVCLEAACALDDHVVLEEGQTHVLRATHTVTTIAMS